MEPLRIWTEFIEKLKKNQFDNSDCIRHSKMNYAEVFKSRRWQSLKNFITKQDNPEIEYGEEKIIFKLKSGEKEELRLDFIVRDNRWYFYMLDGLTIPIKKIPALPFAEFSPYPEFENRMRMKYHISKKVQFYLKLKQEKGKEEALSWFRDGEGYKLNIESWMPYFTLRKAFVVFTAWVENRYWGQKTVIEEFSESRSVLLFRDNEVFIIYDVTGHLQPRIGREEYRELFEDQWRNRAFHVGWNIQFEYDKYDTKMILEKKSQTYDKIG